jgi:uncharacterized protein YuzE
MFDYGNSQTSARTREMGKGLLVDYASNGKPMGLEITSPTTVTMDDVNMVLKDLGYPKVVGYEL